MTFAQKLYLDTLCARNYPEQEPEYIAAKWYHTLWLLIPMLGVLVFLETVKVRYNSLIK